MPVRIECVRGAHLGWTGNYDLPRVVFGRSYEAHVQVDATREVGVSGRHCELIDDDDVVLLRDLGSTNGTFLNDRRLTAETRLASGDRVMLGARGPVFAVTFAERRVAANESPRPPVERRSRSSAALAGLVVALVAVAAAGAIFVRLRDGSNAAVESDVARAEIDTREFPRSADLAPLEEIVLEDEPERPLSELPPLDEWALGRWRLVEMRGQVVVGPVPEDEELIVDIARDPEIPDLFIATAVKIGAARERRELADRRGRPVIHLRFLRAASERGGVAYFRVSRFDTRDLAAGGDGWIARNARAWIDLRRGRLLGDAGAFTKEVDK